MRKNKTTIVPSNISDATIIKMTDNYFLKVTFTGISQKNYTSKNRTYKSTNVLVMYLDIEYVPYFATITKKALGIHIQKQYAEIQRLQDSFRNGIHIPA